MFIPISGGYATNGESDGVIAPLEKIAITEAYETKGYPKGQYRLYLELEVGQYGVLQTETIEVELR